jgi:hypothetical protein
MRGYALPRVEVALPLGPANLAGFLSRPTELDVSHRRLGITMELAHLLVRSPWPILSS